MENNNFSFAGKLWLTEGPGGWHFVNLPEPLSQEIKAMAAAPPKRGWGSLPVRVTIGKSRWKTSIFPSKEGYYLLSVKKEVRESEKIGEGDSITVALELLDLA